MSDDSWRVREMSAKVVRAHEIDAAGALTLLCADAVPRVRIAAGRSLAVVGAAEAAEAVRALVDDAEPAVARAAERALREMARRLDRNLDV